MSKRKPAPSKDLPRTPRPQTLSILTLEDRITPIVSGSVFQDFNFNGTFDPNGTIPAAGGGTVSTAVDVGLAGVVVTAFGANNTVVGTATTNLSGSYTLAPTVPGALRIEFTNLPLGYFFGPQGGSANTAVQFTAATDLNPVVNLAAVRPEEFSPDNPLLITSVYVFGGITANDLNPNNDVVVSFPYNSGAVDGTPDRNDSQIPTTHDIALKHNQVGTTWGLTYDQVSNKLYAAAFTKRHAGYGPNGPGAIYQASATPGANASLFADLNSIFPDSPAGDLTNLYRDINNNPVTFRQNATGFEYWARDGLTRVVDSNGVTRDVGWDSVGKTALGGVASNTTGTELYTVALADRRFYVVPTSGSLTTSTVQRVNLPVPSSVTGRTAANPLGDLRPFAVEYHKGLVYVGAVNSAESTQNTNDLRAYVFVYDPARGAFVNAARQTTTSEPVFDVPLNYDRGIAHMGGNTNGRFPNGIAPPDPAEWRAWSPTFRTIAQQPDAIGRANYPQPMLTGLSFDGAGNVSLGIRDRSGDQFGRLAPADPLQQDNFSFFGLTAGDTLQAFINTPGNLSNIEFNTTTPFSGWGLEQNGRSPDGTRGTGPQNTGQGPGNGEFYFEDELPRDSTQPPVGVRTEHDEVTVGGIVQLPGRRELVVSSFDPIRLNGAVNSGGFRWFDTQTGETNRSYEIYVTPFPDANSTFAKANGIGDVVAVTDTPPIEIGNYLWLDANQNGIQDAGEVGVSNTVVQLYSAGVDGVFGNTDDVLLGSATTDATGNYYFSSADGTSTASKIVGLNLTQFTDYQLRINLGQAPLTGFGLSPTRAATGANAGAIDSDASLLNGQAVISLTTGRVGTADHSLDAGFVELPTLAIGNLVWNDLNNNGLRDTGEPGIDGVTVRLFNRLATTQLATTITSGGGIYNFTNLAASEYIVQIDTPSGFISSTGTPNSLTGPFEPGITANLDNQDHGTRQPSGVIRSGIVRLESAGSVNNPSTTGNRANDANFTIDFGLIQPLSLGNFVWDDVNNNGIFDANELGLGGVRIDLLSPTGSIVSTTQTNAVGNYLFTNLSAGAYTVRVTTPAGYTTSTGKNGSTTGPFEPGVSGFQDNQDHGTASGAFTISSATLNEPGTAGNPDSSGFANLRQDFGFFRPLFVGNFVWDDANNNGKFDASERGIAGVTVELLDATGKAIAGTITDSTGGYLFGGLGASSYSVRVFTPNGFTTSTGKNGSVTGPYEPGIVGNQNNEDHGTANGSIVQATPFELLAPGANPDSAGFANLRQDFGFFQPQFVGNFVWNDANNNGRFDPTESAIAQVPVELLDENGIAISSTLTNDRGEYLFGGLGTGTYSVRITPPNGFRSSTGTNTSLTGPYEPGIVGNQNNEDHGTGLGSIVQAAPFSLLPFGTNPDLTGTANLRQDFGLFQPLTVGNLVFRDLDNDGKLNGGDFGLPNVTVRLLSSTGTVLATQTTNGSGNYLFTNLGAGEYQVEIDLPANDPAFSSSSGTGPSGSGTGPFEPAPLNNPNDNEDKGTGVGTVVRTNVFSLLPAGSNPDLAGLGNLRQDFGLRTLAVTPPNPPPVNVPASISGYVYLDIRTINGVRELPNGEIGIGGTRITLTGVSTDGTAIPPQFAFTDANGFYRFTTLVPGSYTITETQPPGFYDGIDTPGSLGGTSSINDVIFVSIASGDDGVEYNFGEILPASVFGFTYEDLNRNKMLDTDDAPIPNVRVTISGTAFSGSPLARPLTPADTQNGLVAITDGGGRYEFPFLPPGTYSLVQEQPAGFDDFFESVQEPVQRPATIGDDVISNIFADFGVTRGALNFGEVRDLPPPPTNDPTKRDFLGSTVSGANRPPSTTPPVNVTPDGSPTDPSFNISTGNTAVVRLVAVGAGAGRSPLVRVFDYGSSVEKFRFFAYEETFTGGVRVSTADVDGDGTEDIITATGVGGGPRIRVFSGVTGAPIRDYFAFESTFRGGVFVAAGDVDGDGFADIIVGPEVGGGPRVTTFSGANGREINNFFAFDVEQRGGVRVATADLNNDGFSDIIVATGSTVETRVRSFDGRTLAVLNTISPFNATFTGGVFVTTGDVNGDGTPDIITGADVGGGPHIQVFSGTTNQSIASFFAYDIAFTGGARVAAADLNGDGTAEIITGSGVGRPSQIRVYNGAGTSILEDFFAFDSTYIGGVYVG